MADEVARFLTYRAESEHSYRLPPPETHKELLARLRLSRQKFSPLHKGLNTYESQTVRKIQTNTFIHESRLCLMFSNTTNEHCKKCREVVNLFHATWGCPAIWPQLYPTQHTIETWEAALGDSALGTQRELIWRAQIGAAETGAPERVLHSIL